MVAQSSIGQKRDRLSLCLARGAHIGKAKAWREHRDDAVIEAAMRAEALWDAGDLEGQRVWLRVWVMACSVECAGRVSDINASS